MGAKARSLFYEAVQMPSQDAITPSNQPGKDDPGGGGPLQWGSTSLVNVKREEENLSKSEKLEE